MSTKQNKPRAEALAREYLTSVLEKQRELGAPPVTPEQYERALKHATASFDQLVQAARFAT
jgi:hypothetical protein